MCEEIPAVLRETDQNPPLRWSTTCIELKTESIVGEGIWHTHSIVVLAIFSLSTLNVRKRFLAKSI